MFSFLLSFIFPQTLDEQLSQQTHALIPETTTVNTPRGKSVTCCAKYTTEPVGACIRILKKRTDQHSARLLALLLHDTLLAEIADGYLWNPEATYIIPVPLTKRSQKARGYNQVLAMCAELPQELRAMVRTDILTRTKDTPEQKGLTRTARLTNVTNVFNAQVLEDATKLHLVLIDDVVTTGATIDAAVSALTHAGYASVQVVTLSRA